MLQRLLQLARHSAVYGLGGIVSRLIAVVLLPVYTRYLDPEDLGAVGVVVALTAVLVTILRGGISSAFFRFYFDSPEPERQRVVLRTSFWFTMASATAGLAAGVAAAGPLASLLGIEEDGATLVRAAFVGLWAQMNYEQLTSLFRVEQRSTAFVAASLANVTVTVGATLLLVIHYRLGALGIIVGSFTGTLAVYAALVGYRREQLGLGFDRALFRAMQRFGLPLVPSALALIAVNFSDRFLLSRLADLTEVGLYEVGVRVASAMVLLLTAFRMAWPAFAYSIEDDDEAKRTYAYVLTYLVAVASWASLGLALLAPWLVDLLTTEEFQAGARVVAPLAFASVLLAGYIVVAIGVGRARRTQFNWVVTGAAALVNVGLNLALVPRYGMEGAAAATVAAYAVMFAGMTWHAQRIYPVPYQWRRVGTALAAAGGLAALGMLLEVPLGVAVALALAYPLALLPLGFYLPVERAGALSLAARARPRSWRSAA